MKAAPAIAKFVFLLSLLVVSCGPSGRPVTTSPEGPAPSESPSYQTLVRDAFIDPAIPRITAEELKLRLGSAMIVVDNRSEYKFKAGHLAGAINITYSVNSPFPGAEEQMDRDLSRLPNDSLKVFYCD